MMMSMHRTKFIFFFTGLFILAFVSSCKKDTTPPPAPTEGMLEIGFDATTINSSLADSVIAFFTKTNSNQPIMKRLRKENGKWVTEISDLSSGQWNVVLNFYARSAEANDYAKRFYSQTKSFTITANTNNTLSLKAPKGKFEDVWKTYLLLVDAQKNVSVILSANGTDPHLQVRIPEKEDYYFYVDRSAYQVENGSSTLVAADAWECADNCYTGNNSWIISEEFMLPYAQQLQNKNWQVGEVFIIIMNTRTGEESTFFYLYKKSWFI